MKVSPKTLLVFFVFISSASPAQKAPSVSDAVRTGNILNRLQTQNGLSTGDLIMPASTSTEHEIEGDAYWDVHWGKGAIQFYEKDRWATGYTIRHNIQRNDFEFRMDKDIRVIEGNKIRHMVFVDSISGKTRFLVNGRDYKEEGISLSGFLEVLVEGDNALMKGIRLEILKPDFSPALNVGSKNTRILKKESYFYVDGKEIFRIKSRKSVESLLVNREEELNNFIKNEGIRFNREADLIKFFSKLNATH